MLDKKSRCQQAFDDYFNKNRDLESYIILKITAIARKHGMRWFIGDLAEFKMKSVVETDLLHRNMRKIRVICPLLGFDVMNNSSKAFRVSGSSNQSVSSASNQSSSAPNFQKDEIILLENPNLIGAKYDDLGNDIAVRDEHYLSVMCSRIAKFNSEDFRRRLQG